jgi:protein-S-isoprenylcysteine O-methyltransferase Ste14
MNGAVALLIDANFCMIGALPIVFFRRDGRLNLLWWLTALPLFVAPVLVAIAALTGWSARWTSLVPHQDAVAAMISACSIALIAFTLGTHRVRVSLWHQNNDAPQGIVTIGAYRLIRHPFYAAFLLAMLASSSILPHPAMLALFVWQFLILNYTAAKEETRLAGSTFGPDYIDYVKRTGRFFPRLGGDAAAVRGAPAQGVRE